MPRRSPIYTLFFFNDTAPTEIYALALHDALPICGKCARGDLADLAELEWARAKVFEEANVEPAPPEKLRAFRSEKHTSELQSQSNLVCRLLLEKKKK